MIFGVKSRPGTCRHSPEQERACVGEKNELASIAALPLERVLTRWGAIPERQRLLARWSPGTIQIGELLRRHEIAEARDVHRARRVAVAADGGVDHRIAPSAVTAAEIHELDRHFGLRGGRRRAVYQVGLKHASSTTDHQ